MYLASADPWREGEIYLDIFFQVSRDFYFARYFFQSPSLIEPNTL